MIFFLFLILLHPPKAVTVPHQATLYYQNPSCTNSSPCQLQVYRAVCPTATTCPTFGNGHGWTRLTSGSVTATPTASGTTWVIIDQDPVLQDNTTYAYAALCSWLSSPNQTSGPSPVWSGTTSSGNVVATPATPTVGAGNSVQ